MVATAHRRAECRSARERIRPAIDRASACDLAAPQRDDDLLTATIENDAAVLNDFDGELVGLVSHLQTKDLPFRHRFAVHDREAGAVIEGNRADDESGLRNLRTVLLRLCRFRCWFPAYRPERVTRIVCVEG